MMVRGRRSRWGTTPAAGDRQAELPEKLANKAMRENGPIAQTGHHVGHLGAKELVGLGGGSVAVIGHKVGEVMITWGRRACGVGITGGLPDEVNNRCRGRGRWVRPRVCSHIFSHPLHFKMSPAAARMYLPR
jgi:hypothetical protein